MEQQRVLAVFQMLNVSAEHLFRGCGSLFIYLLIMKPFLMQSFYQAVLQVEMVQLFAPQSSNKEEYCKEYIRVRHLQKKKTLSIIRI